MRIRLRDCEIVLVNLAEEVGRLSADGKVLAGAGLTFQRVDAIRCSPGPVGRGLSHIKALRAWDLSRPLLVLEDDIDLTPDYRDEIEVPDDADAVYLGASNFGAVEDRFFTAYTNSVLAEPISAGVVRVHNMLSSHAILH